MTDLKSATLSAAEAESGTGGTLAMGERDTLLSGVSIDTRTLQDGALFFAIRGPNQDGHRFILDALSKGALGVVVQEGFEFPGKFPPERVLIKVADTHQALKNLASSVRRRWPGTLVAITGSMGKTTTKEFAAQILQAGFRVYRTPGNYNNLFGLPLALLGLRRDYDFGIFEMGMSAPGEIAEMCAIASPAVGILTNVAPVHLAFFDSLEKIAQAKGELVEALPDNGTLIYNEDDPFVRAIAARFAGSKISFGQSGSADVRADSIKILSLDRTQFQLTCNGAAQQAAIPFAGAHYVMNVLPAIALSRHYGVELPRIVERLGSLQPVAMRGQILRFKEGFTVIDDSYNSSPRALIQMVDVLSSTPSFTRRILVAGEMLELGSVSDQLHAECGAYAAARGLDFVIGIQGAAREIVRSAVQSGLPEFQAHFYADAGAAADFIKGFLQPRDLMLVKGSRDVHTEKIVRDLCSRFDVLSS
jgi:UDP-N-acetylmuramoyl-tripeptide--D-alanyl-D-alanine ligase